MDELPVIVATNFTEAALSVEVHNVAVQAYGSAACRREP